MTNRAQDQQTFADSDELRAALERMHERDRQRVAAGELLPSDLHAIPAEVARRATVHWDLKERTVKR